MCNGAGNTMSADNMWRTSDTVLHDFPCCDVMSQQLQRRTLVLLLFLTFWIRSLPTTMDQGLSCQLTGPKLDIRRVKCLRLQPVNVLPLISSTSSSFSFSSSLSLFLFFFFVPSLPSGKRLKWRFSLFPELDWFCCV